MIDTKCQVLDTIFNLVSNIQYQESNIKDGTGRYYI